MNENLKTAIKSVFEASNNGQIHFGQVIEKLSADGVISYFVDYRCGRITCYFQSDMAIDIDLEHSEKQIGDAFDHNALKEAIRGAQEGCLEFPEFRVLSQRAGCICYIVWISGRHVTYFGRRGEAHFEYFPS